MLLIAGLVIMSVAVVIIRSLLPNAVNAAPLGWMSEQWLTEHRASHPP